MAKTKAKSAAKTKSAEAAKSGAKAKTAATVTEAKSQSEQATTREGGAVWTFLTNHGHVLICLAREPELTQREVSLRVGITERAVQRIVADLEEARVLARTRDGRRNRYEIQRDVLLRHPLEAHRSVDDLLTMVLDN